MFFAHYWKLQQIFYTILSYSTCADEMKKRSLAPTQWHRVSKCTFFIFCVWDKTSGHKDSATVKYIIFLLFPKCCWSLHKIAGNVVIKVNDIYEISQISVFPFTSYSYSAIQNYRVIYSHLLTIEINEKSDNYFIGSAFYSL